MSVLRRRGGFTLIELLVVILILAILMAIALPLYLRAVRDSNRQTCRSNMQTIANALQAFKVRSANHVYPGQAAAGDPINLADPTFVGPGPATDLQVLPQCPNDNVAGDNDDYTATEDAVTRQLTISCNSSDAAEQAFHNTDSNGVAGFQVGEDSN